MRRTLFSTALVTALASCLLWACDGEKGGNHDGHGHDEHTDEHGGEHALPVANIFAPDVISTGNEFAITFMPDGKETYFTRIEAPGKFHIYRSAQDANGEWQTPERILFGGDSTVNEGDPFINPSGTRIQFMSFATIPGDTISAGEPHVWYSSRLADGTWDKARPFDSYINSIGAETFSSVDREGNLYFTTFRFNNMSDIMVSRVELLANQEAEVLHSGISQPETKDSNPCISPDGNLLVFISDRANSLGAADVYATRKGVGDWALPINLGKAVNTEHVEYCPAFSPDMKTFYFSRRKNLPDGEVEVNIYSIPWEPLYEAQEWPDMPTTKRKETGVGHEGHNH